MKSSHQIANIAALIISGILFSDSLFAQADKSDLFVGGVYIRVASVQFDKALLLDQWGRDEITLLQRKKTISFGAGVAVIPKDRGFGLNLGANFWTITLENFRMTDSPYGTESPYDPIYKDIRYSMLLFDTDLYLTPISKIPIALTLGFALGCSFQSYTFTSDVPEHLWGGAGDRSHIMFRYGTIVGCKLTPWKYFSLDFEYRPMSAYSTTQSLEFVRSDEKYNYYKFTEEKKEGVSEKILVFGLSIYLR
jgi:hypothetical protein